MKVLHLIDSGGMYGAEKMLLSLVREQIAQGTDVLILSAGELDIEPKAIEDEARRLKLPVKPWRMKSGLNIPEACHIARWANDKGYSVLHSHGYKFNILLSIIPKFCRSFKIVSTVHGYLKPRVLSKLWVYYTLDKLLLSRMDRVIFVGENQKKIKSLSQAKIEIIPNGIEVTEIDRIQCATHISLPKNGEYFKFIVVGRLSNEKNISYAIHIFLKLLKERPSSHLNIIGDGPDGSMLRDLVRSLNIESKVSFLGYRHDAIDLISTHDVLILSSITEGFPITVLEAMYLKTLIAYTDVGSISTVLKKNTGGVIINGKNATLAASSISSVLKDPVIFRERIEFSFDTVIKCYTSSVMAKKYLNAYNLALDGKF